MTRRSDLMCEDIFGCDHALETPISHDGEIVAWACRCGARREWVSEDTRTETGAVPIGGEAP